MCHEFMWFVRENLLDTSVADCGVGKFRMEYRYLDEVSMHQGCHSFFQIFFKVFKSTHFWV